MSDWVAWRGQVDFCETIDETVAGVQKKRHIYTVSFVAIVAQTKAALTLDEAKRRCGHFLFPHLWAFGDWTVYSGTKKLGRAEVIEDPLPPDGGDRVAAAVEKAISARVRACADVFKYDETATVDLTGDATLVNATAGLVHWPAALSGGSVLRRTFLVGISEAVAGLNPKDIVVLPNLKLKVGGGEMPWDMPAKLPADGIVTLDAGAGPQAIQLQIEVRPGRPADIIPPAAPTLVATQTRVTPLVARSALTESLNPLGLLRTALEKARGAGLSITPKAYAPLRLCIPRMLGAGWGAPYTGAKGIWRTPYILHSIPGARDVLNISQAPFPHRVDIGRDRLAELLGVERTDPDLALVCYDINTDPSKRKVDDPNTVADAWLRSTQQLAPGDSYHARMPFWLAILGDSRVANGAAAAEKWAAIRAQLTSAKPSGLNRRAIGERNAAGALALLGRQAMPQPGDVELEKLVTAQKKLVRELEAGNDGDVEKNLLKGLVFILMTEEAKDLLDSLATKPRTLLEDKLADACDDGVEDFAKRLATELSLDRALAKDEGLHLIFESREDEVRTPEDERMRGYALALRAGILEAGAPKPKWDSSAKRWITETAFSLSSEEDKLIKSGAKPMWLPDAVGSTIEQGQRMVAAIYQGHPLLSTPYKKPDVTAPPIEPESGKNVDQDGFKELEFLWPRWLEPEAALPLLAYGAAYQGVAATIGNAGEVREAEFRVKGSYVHLKPANTCFDDAMATVYYRSREKLGAPAVVGVDNAAYEMSEETRAAAYHAHLANLAREAAAARNETKPPPPPVKVALLTRGAIWQAATDRVANLTAYPPKAGIEFIERWLNADCLRAMLQLNTGYSHSAFNKGRLKQIQAFRDAMVKKLREQLNKRPVPRDNLSESYHPAFGAYGVRVAFNGANGTNHVYALPQVIWDAAADKFVHNTQPLTLSVKPADGNKFDETSRELTVAPGSFVEVCFFSLVDKAFIGNADSGARFHPLPDDFKAFKDSWLACEGVAFHFEAAPDVPAQHPMADCQLQIAKPDEGQTEKIRVSIASKNRVPADWIRKFNCAPHDFHWTGYPIEFPAVSIDDGKKLGEDWMVVHADTHSERRDLEATFHVGTFFDAGDPTKWCLGAETATSIPLMERAFRAELRPANHTIYVAKPVVRFRKWLKPAVLNDEKSTLCEQVRFGASAVVPGIAPDLVKERLRVPPVIGDFPLVATYKADPKDGFAPTTNGALLVIDEAIMATDERAKVGGVGDTLEIDVLSSRGITDDPDATGPSWRQIGPNPIFERAPTYANPSSQPRLDLLPPSGLSHDISSNGLVSQTALTVIPTGGHGQWLMAQVRVRRWIEPEVLLGTKVDNLEIPLRVAGEDIVPLDFAIEFDAEVPELLFDVLGFKVLLGRTDFSPPLTKAPDRYLVSWHKGRWKGGGAPTWRAQVLAQEHKPGLLTWENVGKSDCTAQSDWPKVPAIQKSVKLRGQPKSLRLVPMSDYSASRWLFFIGDFFAGQPIGAEKLALREGAAASLTIEQGRAASLPKVIELSTTPANVESHWLLVYRPVRDLMRGRLDREAGLLLGAWRNIGGTFERLPGDAATPLDLKGCFGYLCTFQRASALSTDEKAALDGIASTRELFSYMFTDQGRFASGEAVKESLIRLVPKVLGPIGIKQ